MSFLTILAFAMIIVCMALIMTKRMSVLTALIFVPMIPAMAVAALWVVFVAYLLGRRERKRLGLVGGALLADEASAVTDRSAPTADAGLRRPKLLAVNFALTAALLTALVMGLLPLAVLFMVACALALVINYPAPQVQKERIAAHAGNALAVVAVIFAAGVLTGILSGTKMVDAMANSVVAFIPPSLGPHIAVITGLLSIPFTFFLSNDAFYFGVLPILNQAAATYGVTAVEMGRASIVGQGVHLLSPLVPSTYLLVGLAGVELGDHQRYTLKWSFVSALVLLGVGLLTGVIPFAR